MSERREVLRMIPHGLQVVTVTDGERHHGYVSSWMTQGSFEPPLVVLGVRKGTTSHGMIGKTGVLCVHFPGREQQDLVRRFFRPAGRSGDRLAGLAWEPGPETGCPVLSDVLGHAECRVVHRYPGGDHEVVVAEVLDARVHREGDPLALADTPWQYGG